MGWCHAAPRYTLRRLADWPEEGDDFHPENADPVGAIVCYVIAPENRRQGVATALLGQACELLADLGMEWVEAYPHGEDAKPPASLTADAAAYHGSLSMYRAAGFEPVYKLDDITIVRRRLDVAAPSHDSAPASS